MSSEERSDSVKGVDCLGNEHTVQKDTRYSWFVCICTFTTQVFVLGVLHAFGVFFVELVKDFKSSKGQTAWIGSLAYGLSMTFGPITSMLVGRFGNSKVMVSGGVICAVSLVLSSFARSTAMMFLTFSSLYSIGTCMATSPTMTITPQYFDKYLAIATGITVAGSSFGTLIIGPLSQAIIDYGGWRLAFRIYAGFCLLTCVLNSQIHSLPHMKRRPTAGQSFIKDFQIWKDRVFVVWTMAITLVMFGFYIPYVHLVSFAIDQGVSPDHASMLMMIMGATTAVGRIMFGKIVQYGVLHRLHMHQLSMLVTGTGVMVLPLLNTYPLIVLYVIIVGLVDGCYVVLLPILTASLMGIENSVLAWGFMIGSSSVTFTLGPPAAGALYDLTGSYNVAFHCAGLPILAGSALLFLIPWAQRTARGRNVLREVVGESAYSSSQPSQESSGHRRTPSLTTICDEEVTMEDLATKTRSNLTIRSTGTTPYTVSSYVDKATSTDDTPLRFPYSMDVEEVLSQLSYNSAMFEELMRRSANPSPARTPSTGVQEVPRIPPPTESTRSFREDRTQRYSAVASPISQGSCYASDLQSPTCMPSPGSVNSAAIIRPSASVPQSKPQESENELPRALSSQQAQPQPPAQVTQPMNDKVPAQIQLQRPLQPTPAGSVKPPSKPEPSAISKSSTPSIDPLLNKQTRTKQMSIRRPRFDNLNTQSDANTLNIPVRHPDINNDVTKDATTRRCKSLITYRRSSVSPAIAIIRQPSPESPLAKLTENDQISPMSKSSSFLARQVAEIEASTRGSDVTDDKESTSKGSGNDTGSESSIRFDEENQVTVIAPKKQTPPGPSRLEDLFKPMTSEEGANQSFSYEVIDAPSDHEVAPTSSNQGVIDVFKHLFDDEDGLLPGAKDDRNTSSDADAKTNPE